MAVSALEIVHLLCRLMAVLGEMACAAANPIKTKHFYLCAKSTFEYSPMMTGDCPFSQHLA